MIVAKNFTSLEKTENGYLIKTDGPSIKVIFVTNEIVRVRVSFTHQFEEESYILTTTAWDDRFDDFLKNERSKVKAVQPNLEETEEKLIFSTPILKLECQKQGVYFSLYNNEGVLLHQDLKGKPFVQDHLGRVFHYQVASRKSDAFYGFGEKTGDLNKAGHRLRFASKDSIGYDSQYGDGLYKHIPFIIKMNRETRQAVGLFYHNTYESFFDAAQEISGYYASDPGINYAYFGADGGDLDLFYLGGNSLKRIVENFTTLTGKSALMPKQALGYLGSTMYYAELDKDADKAIINFTKKTNKMGIPMDGFFLSSGYTVKDGRRYLFYWNLDRFTDPKAFFKEMTKMGVVVSANVKPGVLTSHPYFADFVKNKVFIKTKEGDQIYLDRWWGGTGAFLDFTNPKARKYWKEGLKKALLNNGCEAIWNDNNEYDSLEDREALCHFDGKGGTIGQLKPLMATIMAKCSFDALAEAQPHRRPYVTSRGGSAGIGRYAQTWCGDNLTEWKTIRYNMSTLLGMGLSGMAHCGGDVGGFFGPAPTAEMLTRWVQSAVFYPRFSIHSASTDNTVTEPWMYQSKTYSIKNAIAFRYRLMPYFYSLNYQSSIDGSPLLRPMIYEFQDDSRFDNTFDQFMLGSALLAAPVMEEGLYNSQIIFPNEKWIELDNEAGIPTYLRADQILPLSPQDENDSLELHHYPTGKEANFTLYEDDGVSQNYKKGDFLKTLMKAEGQEVINYTFTREGRYKSPLKTLTLILYREDKAPLMAKLNDQKLEHFLDQELFNQTEEGLWYNYDNHTAVVKIKNPKAKKFTLTVSFNRFNLLGEL